MPSNNAEDGTDRVLVVDDERVERIMVCRAVERAGFRAVGVGGVAEAVRELREGGPFAFVVLDLQLGEQDGLQLLRSMAQSGEEAALLLVSAFDERVRSASVRLAGHLGLRVAGSLMKPIPPARLQEMLADARARGANRSVAAPAPGAGADGADLERAILAREIRPDFQPKISVQTGKMVGVEALARWRAASGPVSPAEFIPLAERTGLIGALTDSVLDQALCAYKGWRPHNPECSVAVNISPLLLDDASLPERVERALRKHELGAGCLVVEITESAAFSDVALATEVLTRLRIRGVGLSIDDFGTGHSSLLSLLDMPFSELKIDRAFVGGCHERADANKIVRAAASLAREMGLRVVAEGVEVPEMLEVLREARCDVGQGWLFGRPMGADSLTELLKKS